MSHDDFAFEPMRGLPAMLPDGERLLWQGSPAWKSLAVHDYHARKIALYFGVLVLWRIGVGINNAHAPSDIAISCLFLLALGAIAIGVLSLLAYFASHVTVYSVTSRRVLLRHGIAVPMTLNIPFNAIESAELKQFADRTGDIAFKVTADQRVGYMITWPHLRPGFFTRPQPSLKALADPTQAAEILAQALAADTAILGVRLEPPMPKPAQAQASSGAPPRVAATA
ncbi:MAG: PH domain-containing protein [Pseudomonadota bacterium]|nr:PH domain-containing protein [Pseudomonadota bacterium]